MTAFDRAARPGPPTRPSIALAHDYLTQRGGAERVVVAMTRAFPGTELHTTLFRPDTTFAEFGSVPIRTSPLNRHRILRSNHRLALPFLAPTASRMLVDADLTIVSSSGWAHGIRTTGRKIVYCHAPARWLYQSARYIGSADNRGAAKRLVVGAAAHLLGPALRRWDRRSAHTADLYLANSSSVRDAIRDAYGIEAQVLFPPPAVTPGNGPEDRVAGISRPFVLCVARLLPYKNVDVVIDAVARIPGIDVVVVGAGPLEPQIARQVARTPNARLLSSVTDPQLRWLYRTSVGIVAASHEDFGLTPVEAASFGRPTAALRAGGYLDTIRERTTGIFFDEPTVEAVSTAVSELLDREWDAELIRTHADAFSETRFIAELRRIAAREPDDDREPVPT